MKISSIKGKVDFGIITVREDEFRAVLKRIVPEDDAEGNRRYAVSRIQISADEQYLAAVVRCSEQGEGEGQDVARDLIEDLDPQWLLLVGIAGAVPAYEFTLGDVVAATRLQDFCVGAALEGRAPEYAVAGGPMHKAVQDYLAFLPAMEGKLHGWNDEKAIGMAKPPVDLSPTKFYGDEQWQRKVKQTLEKHFGTSHTPRPPLFTTGPIASSDNLIKDTNTVKAWQKAARHILAVEMELAGVYRAARRKKREYPILAIRGISDIVGYDREHDWTSYACHSAAAFAHAIIKTRPITPRVTQASKGIASRSRVRSMPMSTQSGGISKTDIAIRKPIGAFCTSLKEPVTDTQKSDGTSTQPQKSYFETIRKLYIESLPNEEGSNDSRSIWFSGETLWGILYSEKKRSPLDSIKVVLWRAIHAFAQGLAEVNSNVQGERAESLMISGVSFVGDMVEEQVTDQTSLYKGAALDACKHLENKIDANSIIVGFVIPKRSSGEGLFESTARSPMIEARGLKEYLHDYVKASSAGCNILLNVVPDNNRQLLRFTGWRYRQDLRGLDDYRIIATKITLIPTEERGININYKTDGRWDRAEVTLPLSRKITHWELHELLESAEHTSFNFVKQIYNKGEIKFFVSGESNTSIELQSSRKVDRPRVLITRQKMKTVDFGRYPYCILPTNTHAVAGGANILIQVYRKDTTKALCLSKVPDNVLSSYDSCEDYLDSATPAIEFVFK